MQNIQPIIDGILGRFRQFQMAPTSNDLFEEKGKAILAERLQGFVSKQVPIDFVMLGFPMKSPNNRDKVIGDTPDLAEKVAIDNFATFNQAIKEIYNPGINMSIVSDGYVFNDLMEVSDNTVQRYEEMSLDMAKNSPLTWYKLKDFYSANMSLQSMRDKVMGQFGITDTELERRIMFDPDVNTLYMGMIKFMNLDLAIKNFDSKNQLQKAAKKLAREMMFRNEAYSKLVQTEFSTHIRLSMHPSINSGTKFSFQLIPSSQAWTSPWHCALLLTKQGQYATIHKKDAIANGFELIYKDGRPFYFQEH